MNRFQKHKLIVPFYNEIYLRKTVLIQTLTDADHLFAFSQTVKTHFSEDDVFQAEELISITWNVYATFSPESVSDFIGFVQNGK